MEVTVRAVQLAELQRSRANSNTASMSSMSKSAEENKRLKEALAQRQIRDAEIKRRLGETGTYVFINCERSISSSISKMKSVTESQR